MLRFIKVSIAILGLVGSIMACEHDGNYGEDYGNLFEEGLALTKDNHLQGDIEGQCFLCHSTTTIHLGEEGKNSGEVNLAAIREIVAAEGSASCATCHPVVFEE